MADKSLESPLLFGAQSDYATGVHPNADSTVDIQPDFAVGKFGVYVSRAKARAQNTLRVACLPFNGIMLICIMFLTFGSYWSYDIPGSIETELTAWFGGSYNHSSNLLFYSIYSWPNCILAFFGGVIIDKFTGVRKGAMLFCGLVALGQFIFSLGCQLKLYYLALFGRFVFGLGGENLTVAQNSFTVRWFDGKRLALAFGLVVAFSRIGTSVNFVASPRLADSPITFKQTFYAPGACDTIDSSQFEYSGRINECVSGRLVQCDTLKSDALPEVLFYPLHDSMCGAPLNHTTKLEFAADKCVDVSATPFGAGGTYSSAIIHLVPDTNEYSISLYTQAACAGTKDDTFGQGTGCFNGTVAGANFKIPQDITAPCYVATYSDVACAIETNRWGMTRDVCTTPLDPKKDAYKFTIDPGTGTPLTVWTGMAMCGLSFLACIFASTSDYWGEKKVDDERAVYLSTLSKDEAAYVKKLDEMNEPTSDDISFQMIKRIPRSAWLLFIITAVFYVAILNFYQVASDMMQNTGDMISATQAGLFMAIPNFVAIIGSPLGGFTVDKFGRALVFISVACSMLICAHVFFLALAYGWVSASPVPVMIWLGITYSLGASCLWPILAFIVEKDALGTAYGCMTSVQNLFLAVASLLIGQLQDWASDNHPGVLQYTLPIWIFIGCATIALILTLILIGVDKSNGGKLNASAEERQARIAKEDAEQEERNQAASGQSTSPLAIEKSNLGIVSEAEFVSSSPSKSLNPTKQ